MPTESQDRDFDAEGARLLQRLARLPPEALQGAGAAEARALAERMRDARALEALGRFTDRLRALLPEDVLLRTRQAQALVDLGMPQAARDLLLACPPMTAAAGLAWSEHQGLLGRVAKQIFRDAPDRGAAAARAALRDAIAAYRGVFEQDRSQYWHGINLAALLQRPEAAGLDPAAGTAGAAAVARQVLTALDAVPEEKPWRQATLAEARLALGEVEGFEAALASLLRPIEKGADAAPREASAFALNALRRQLAEIWELDSPQGPLGERGPALLGLLRGALLREPTGPGELRLDAAVIAAPRSPALELAGLEKNFGGFGVQTAQWWDLGRRRARSVAAIWGPDRAGRLRRLGTGFLVALLPEGAERPILSVLTNAHVIGGDPAAAPCAIPDAAAARIRFEGAAGEAAQREHRVAEILWSSPVRRHDATLLRLDPPPVGLAALPLASALPPADSAAQLFIIGHPLGDELSFSFQDNLLLDHDGPPSTRPRQAGVTLLHYRTPTEPGNSGSPVFVEDRWRAIALHHAGTSFMPKLNGKADKHEANEGISLASIAATLVTERGHRLVLDAPEEEERR
ncbi:trypsin-like serine peptidase [Roseomonas sp. GCM10028921]